MRADPLPNIGSAKLESGGWDQSPTVLPPCPSLSRPCSLSQESQKLLEHRYPELPPERRWRAKSNRSQPLLPLPLNRRTCGGMQHRAESEETAPHITRNDPGSHQPGLCSESDDRYSEGIQETLTFPRPKLNCARPSTAPQGEEAQLVLILGVFRLCFSKCTIANLQSISEQFSSWRAVRV